MAARPSRTDLFDAYQRRHRWLGFPIAVAYKAFDDRALYLAALVTYYSFVSLFPLILLLISILGFVLESNPELRADVVNSAVSGIPGIGSVLKDNIKGLKGSDVAVAVGFFGLAYGGLGATQAAQYAFNTMYAVPRNHQPNPFRSRIRSIGLIAILGLMVLVISAINFVVSNGNQISQSLSVTGYILSYSVGFVFAVVLFCTSFRVLTAADLGWRDVYVGGLVSGAGWELVQILGSRAVVHEVNHGYSLYGGFGVVLAVISVIYLLALVVMISVEVNVVWSRRLWPRSLLSPFTDRIQPTPGDLAAYRGYAGLGRFKGWQKIEVTFDPPDLDEPTSD
jgi:membrane protein